MSPLPKQTRVTVALHKANHKIGDLWNDWKCKCYLRPELFPTIYSWTLISICKKTEL